MLHWLIHKLGWQRGTIEVWWAEDGRLMVGYKCSTCGKLSGVHWSYRKIKRKESLDIQK
jgi:hypothetical protein